MDRTGKIAVALAILTLLVWQFFYARESQKAAAREKQAQAAAALEKAANPAAEAPVSPVTPAVPNGDPAAPVVTAAPPAVESVETVTGTEADYTFSNLGGGVTRAILRNHEAESGKRVVLNEFGSIPIGAISELPGEATRAPFSTAATAPGSITFERTDEARQVQITKKFTVPTPAQGGKNYLVQLALDFTNRGAQPVAYPPYYVHTGSAALVHHRDQPLYTGFKWSGSSKFIDVSWFGAGGFLMFSHPERPTYTAGEGNIAWAAVTNQYFTSLITPVADAKDPVGQSQQRGKSVWARRFAIPAEIWKAAGRSGDETTSSHFGIDGAIAMPGFTLDPGKTQTQVFNIYAGPREYQQLHRLGQGADEVMDFGVFAIVSKTLLNSMNWLNSKLGSYAAAIVVLTLLIKSLLWPLQNKATNSMKKMQALQPKMTEIREKYQDDPTRMNTEVMKLYKDYGVNPVGGCLPMLIQIPIFFGFYNMLGKAVELRNSKFLWVNDLSQPDTVWHLPGLGFPVNVLPLIMAGTMLWQMAISPKSGDPTQQKIFMFMPLIFVFFCYNFASALALYWTVQNLFSVAQLYATRNQAPPKLVKVSASAKKK